MKRFAVWTLIFTLASVCYHLFFYLVLHAHGHSVFPFSLNKHDRFYDFTIFTEKFQYFHTAQFFQVGFPINYPAPVSLVFEFFFKYTAPHEVFAFVSFCVLSFVIPAALFARTLIRRGIGRVAAIGFVAVICLLSWPALLIVDGANAEVIVWLAMLIAMWAYATGRLWLAAAFFGVAASLKLFPFVFLALFLSRRHVGKLLFGVATFLIVSVVSLKILGPTIAIAYKGIAFGLASFKSNYMAQWHTGENGVDHSIFASVKLILVLFFQHPSGDFTGWLRMYLLLTGVGGVLLYFLVIRKLPLLNQVLALSHRFDLLHGVLRRWNADSSLLPAGDVVPAFDPRLARGLGHPGIAYHLPLHGVQPVDGKLSCGRTQGAGSALYRACARSGAGHHADCVPAVSAGPGTV